MDVQCPSLILQSWIDLFDGKNLMERHQIDYLCASGRWRNEYFCQQLYENCQPLCSMSMNRELGMHQMVYLVLLNALVSWTKFVDCLCATCPWKSNSEIKKQIPIKFKLNFKFVLKEFHSIYKKSLRLTSDILPSNSRSNAECIRNKFVALDIIPTMYLAPLILQMKTHSGSYCPKCQRQYLQESKTITNYVLATYSALFSCNRLWTELLEHGVATVISMWIFSFVSMSVSGWNLNNNLLSM